MSELSGSIPLPLAPQVGAGSDDCGGVRPGSHAGPAAFGDWAGVGAASAVPSVCRASSCNDSAVDGDCAALQ